ncbi:MAG: hypothetical protein MUF06_10920 [Pirellulaceae bacterium]|nr:hypothetical protein [Pirellulaceae bacterium]
MPHQPATAGDASLLAEFRRQAGAVLAQERGLTPAGRVKLAGLARQIGLAEEQIEAAIRSLSETSAAEPEGPEVQKFRSRLRKDLAGRSRSILGPKAEVQIVEAAAKKYALDDATARRVLGEVAAELGLQRISVDEAIGNLAQQIDLTAGRATWLAKESWDRLRSAGAKWGIELEIVDQLIDEKLDENRSRRDRSRWIVQTGGMVLGGAIAIGAFAAGLWVLQSPDTSESTGSGSAPEAAVPATPRVAAAAVPPWWDVDLTIAASGAKTRYPAVQPVYEGLVSEDAAQRGAAYEQLAEIATTAPQLPGFRSAMGDLLAGAFALDESDTAAQSLVDALLRTLPAVESPLPDDPTTMQTSYWVGDALAQMSDRRGANDARRQMLLSAVQSRLGVVWESASSRGERQRLLADGVSRRLFAQFTAAAPEHAPRVAELYPFLVDLAVGLSDEEFARLEATLLAAALPAAGDGAPFREAVVRAVSSPDPVNSLKILDAYQRVKDADLKQRLAELLIARAGKSPKSWQPLDVVRAVRQGLGATSSAALTEQDRWQLLRLQADAALARPLPGRSDAEAWLKQTSELAHLANLAMALAQGEAGYALFDAAIDAPPDGTSGSRSADPGDGPAADEPAGGPSARAAASTLGERDQRQLVRMITMLGGYSRLQPVQRASLLRGLAQYAQHHPDVAPREAARVAEYLLAAKDDEELRMVESIVSPLARWLHLRLAIADGLTASKLPEVDRQRLVAALLPDADSAALATIDSQQRALVASALAQLAESAAAADFGPAAVDSSMTDASAVDAAAGALADIYRQRARLLGARESEQPAGNSPAAAGELAIEPLGAALARVANGDDRAYLAQLPRRREAYALSAMNDAQRAVAAGRIVGELSVRLAARQRATIAAAAQQLGTEREAVELAAKTSLAQLHAQEASNLQIWMLYAPQL